MPGTRTRALVLAAGLGARLRPLTDLAPKPLLPVRGRAVVARTLARLAAAGCEAVAINLHHLGPQIRAAVGERFAGVPIVYSEEPILLGTLGALVPLRRFFAGADRVLIVNGDSLCAWPLARLLRRHSETGALATLLLAARADPGSFGGGVGIGDDGRILSFRSAGPSRAPSTRRLVFAGAHVLSPSLLENLPDGPADSVRDLYEPLLADPSARLLTLQTRQPWHDLGTPRRYLEAALDWARRAPHAGAAETGWQSRSAVVEPDATVCDSSLEPGARVCRHARVESSLLLPGAIAGHGSTTRRSILAPGVSLPAGSVVEDSLVMPSGVFPLT
jgi:NDP-sugar pyrophosphorylase family protein